jgi:hypothetical protein
MVSVLSLLSGVVLAGLVYGLSFLPTATLARYDDAVLGLADDESAMPDPQDADVPSDRRNAARRDSDVS